MDDDDALLVVSCAAVAQAVVLFAEKTDEFPRGSKTQILTVNILHFESLLQSAAYASWFVSNLRCTKHTYLRVAEVLRDCGVAFAPAKVKQHSYEKKVAAALYFLGSTGGYREVGAAMGMSRSYVKEITTEAMRVLRAAASRVISFPRKPRGWEEVQAGFAGRHGYPGAVGAIDGTLVEIERPDDFDGFYCRKFYPALNVQAIGSSSNVFMSVEVRPGAWSDSKCWKYSVIGRTVYNTIPPGTHFIGDAGYALLPALIVPYNEREEGGVLSPQQKQFNFLHSSTRMAVESTFGIWKGRFRIAQGVMTQASPRVAADFVVATMVLHNLIIHLGDTADIPRFVDDVEEEVICVDEFHATNQRKIGVLKRNGIADLICS